MESDLTYFARRAEEERSAAAQAAHPEARQRHVEMAERYEDLVRAIAMSHQQLGLGEADDPLQSQMSETGQ